MDGAGVRGGRLVRLGIHSDYWLPGKGAGWMIDLLRVGLSVSVSVCLISEVSALLSNSVLCVGVA